MARRPPTPSRPPDDFFDRLALGAILCVGLLVAAEVVVLSVMYLHDMGVF